MISPNHVTLARLPLLALIIVLLYSSSGVAYLVAAPLILVLILMDSLDGYLARKYQKTSLLGSVLDIGVDRAVEYVMWVVFAHLRLISVVIPLLVIVRGSLVDTIRAVAPARGETPFGMMRTRLGRFLVGSPWMRSSYGIAKAVAFVTLALAYGLQMLNSPLAGGVKGFALAVSWLALALCLVRGAPVLIEAPRLLRDNQGS